MDKKVTGIVAYLTAIGLIIAFVAGDREGAKFHLNQALVLVLANIILGMLGAIPLIGWLFSVVGGIFVLICWIIGLVAAIRDEEKEVPLLGSIKILK